MTNQRQPRIAVASRARGAGVHRGQAEAVALKKGKRGHIVVADGRPEACEAKGCGALVQLLEQGATDTLAAFQRNNCGEFALAALHHIGGQAHAAGTVERHQPGAGQGLEAIAETD